MKINWSIPVNYMASKPVEVYSQDYIPLPITGDKMKHLYMKIANLKAENTALKQAYADSFRSKGLNRRLHIKMIPTTQDTCPLCITLQDENAKLKEDCASKYIRGFELFHDYCTKVETATDNLLAEIQAIRNTYGRG